MVKMENVKLAARSKIQVWCRATSVLDAVAGRKWPAVVNNGLQLPQLCWRAGSGAVWKSDQIEVKPMFSFPTESAKDRDAITP